MALVFKPPFVQAPNIGKQTFVNADGTTTKDVLTTGALGTRIDKIGFASTDTAARVFHVYLYDGTTAYLLGSISVSAGAGNDGTTAAANFLNTSINPQIVDGILTLPTGWKIQAACTTSVTAGKTVTVLAHGGDF